MSPSRAAVSVGLGACVLYWVLLRRPILNWGATPAEVASQLPGDELLNAADGVSTRAIDIEAPPSSVWPWLAHMGPAPRGGAYTYDWIENVLKLNMHSVDQVLPEAQHPQAGTRLRWREHDAARVRRPRAGHLLGARRMATGFARSSCATTAG